MTNKPLFSILSYIAFLSIINISKCEETTRAEELQCGNVRCSSSTAKCVGVPAVTCVCFTDWETYPEDSVEMCNYKKKDQWIAFVLELVVSFGAGHFYTSNLTYAIPKLLYWIAGYTCFIALRVISNKKEENDPLVLMISFAGCLTCVGMIIWQVVDCFMYGLNKYQDGNGIDLKEW
jgi:hypothetical protein